MFKRRVTILIVIALMLLAVAGSFYYFSSDSSELQEARKANDRREFQSAWQHIDDFLHNHPDNREALLLAAETARRWGDYGVAFTLLTKCRNLNCPKDAVDLEFRLLRLQQGDVSEVSGLLEKYSPDPDTQSKALVMESIAVGTLNKLAPNLAAPLSVKESDLPLLNQASRAVDAWLDLRPGHADRVAGLFWRGRVRLMSGDYESGIADLQEAIALDPEHFNARLFLAFQIAQSDPREATVQLEFLRQRDPSNKQVAFALATGYRDIGRLEEATRILDELLVAYPNEVAVLVQRGLIAMDRGQLADAERLLTRAFGLNPESPDVNIALSRYMQLRGDAAKTKEFRERYERTYAAQKQK